MLVIRFFRVGKKNQPSFKIIVTDKRRPPRGGRFVEEVGFWDPLTKQKILRAERIKYWLSVGAKPSNSVYNLLIKEKILEGKKIAVHKKKKGTISSPAPVPLASGTTAGKEEKTGEVKKEPKEEIKTEEAKEKPKEEKKIEENKEDKESQKGTA